MKRIESSIANSAIHGRLHGAHVIDNQLLSFNKNPPPANISQHQPTSTRINRHQPTDNQQESNSSYKNCAKCKLKFHAQCSKLTCISKQHIKNQWNQHGSFPANLLVFSWTWCKTPDIDIKAMYETQLSFRTKKVNINLIHFRIQAKTRYSFSQTGELVTSQEKTVGKSNKMSTCSMKPPAEYIRLELAGGKNKTSHKPRNNEDMHARIFKTTLFVSGKIETHCAHTKFVRFSEQSVHGGIVRERHPSISDLLPRTSLNRLSRSWSALEFKMEHFQRPNSDCLT